jgi:NADPH:quinone reductase-like Zn-dependent oxidoreductase
LTLPCGATAEYVAIDVNYVVHLPDSRLKFQLVITVCLEFSFEQGAGLAVSYFTAYRTLFLKSLFDFK